MKATSKHKEITPRGKRLHSEHVRNSKNKLRGYGVDPFSTGFPKHISRGNRIDDVNDMPQAPEVGGNLRQSEKASFRNYLIETSNATSKIIPTMMNKQIPPSVKSIRGRKAKGGSFGDYDSCNSEKCPPRKTARKQVRQRRRRKKTGLDDLLPNKQTISDEAEDSPMAEATIINSGEEGDKESDTNDCVARDIQNRNGIPRVTDLVLYLVPCDPQEWEQPDHIDHPLTAQFDGEHLRLRLRLRQPSL
eukprot:gene1860-16355_t